jgi:hypothetical protein
VRTVFFLLCVSFFTCIFSQDDGYAPYNKRRIGTMMEQTHELAGLASYSTDDDEDSNSVGNLSPGKSYGFGLGYGYRIMISDCPWSFGLGIRAQYFPRLYYNFGAIMEADFFGWGGKKWSVFAITEYGISVLHNLSFSQKQWNYHACIAELNVYDFSLQLLVQGSFDKYNQALETKLDNGYWAFRLTYFHRL